MLTKFQKHYTRDEARALLPMLRESLDRLCQLRTELTGVDEHVEPLLASGNDIGGEFVNRSIKLLSEMRVHFQEFHGREIQIKDLDRGLIDFPAMIDGREVFLCWEKEEDDVGFWHDIDSGYSGREPL